MKLPATEPLCSNNIDSVLAKDRRKVEPIERKTASELVLGFSRDSPDIDKRTIYFNSQPVSLSLAETIFRTPKISEFEPDLLVENSLAVCYYPHRADT